VTSEREWVRSFVSKLDSELAARHRRKGGPIVAVSDGTKLTYACEIERYTAQGEPETSLKRYETDILVRDVDPDGSWVPRVVIECKLRSVTTHDALTYSAKAATHRSVHPYLRYGFLAGKRDKYALPARLVRHGQQFDFMVSWNGLKATTAEWKAFCDLLLEEIETSRKLQNLLTDNRSATRIKNSDIRKSMTFIRTGRTK
jgi:hypothetical protein